MIATPNKNGGGREIRDCPFPWLNHFTPVSFLGRTRSWDRIRTLSSDPKYANAEYNRRSRRETLQMLRTAWPEFLRVVAKRSQEKQETVRSVVGVAHLRDQQVLMSAMTWSELMDCVRGSWPKWAVEALDRERGPTDAETLERVVHVVFVVNGKDGKAMSW